MTLISNQTSETRIGFDQSRLDKREALIAAGVNPYPYQSSVCADIAVLRDSAESYIENGETFAIRGRIWARRGMGKSSFIDITDPTGKIQTYFQRDVLGEDTYALLRLLDIGDILEVQGPLIRSKVGELTLRAEHFVILAKTVIDIPVGKEAGEQVFYRVADPEVRYRERYMNWILNSEDRQRIRMRGQIISAIRRKMEDDGFLEVNTPAIESIYGGAEARPFETNVWALGGQDAFLRISPELYLKRLVVGGFDRVFSICQNFRNEGIDHSHNPEFTMMEWYEVSTDYNRQMERFETLVSEVCQEIHGTTRILYQGVELDFAPPWRRLPMLDAIEQYAGVNVSEMSEADLVHELQARGAEVDEGLPWGVLVAELFEETCEEHLIQPTFVIDHPIEISPLTKTKRGDSRLVERFEPFICKMEVGNAYSELTDPVDQLERLRAQRDRPTEDEDGGGEYENHPLDEDFIRALGCGMPPTGGVGLGVDRIVMLLTDSASIRDIVPFPMVRTKKD